MCIWEEARMASLAVESTKDFVDEYVVVDAGSTDGTREILRECGDRHGLNMRIFNRPELRLRHARLYAIEQTDAEWILIQDGDEVYHTDGPGNIESLRTLLGERDVVYRAPMPYLYLDFLHTHQKHPVQPPHMFLYQNNGTFHLRTGRRDLPGIRGREVVLGRAYKFNCNVKSPRRMFLRNYWWEWCKATDAHETMTLEEFVKKKLQVDDLNPAIEAWMQRQHRNPKIIDYSEELYGYYPKVIREYIGRGMIRGYEP